MEVIYFSLGNMRELIQSSKEGIAMVLKNGRWLYSHRRCVVPRK
jgi:hypothetical protein